MFFSDHIPTNLFPAQNTSVEKFSYKVIWGINVGVEIEYLWKNGALTWYKFMFSKFSVEFRGDLLNTWNFRIVFFHFCGYHQTNYSYHIDLWILDFTLREDLIYDSYAEMIGFFFISKIFGQLLDIVHKSCSEL